jgi:hypothetical protein
VGLQRCRTNRNIKDTREDVKEILMSEKALSCRSVKSNTTQQTLHRKAQ